MRLNHLTALVSGLAICLFAGCDRDFGNPPRPDVEVVEPDLAIVQSTPDIGLSLRVESPRDVDRVTVDGRDLSFDSATSTWMGVVPLATGYNRLDVRTHIGDEPPFADTLNAFRSAVTVEPIDQAVIPFAVGGHSVSVVPNGTMYLFGGASTAAGSGFAEFSIRAPGETRFMLRPWRLLAGRVGHTITVLPDGRLLVLGGAFIGGITEIEQLIFEVELFDPADNSVTTVPVSGSPILRMYHTALLRDHPDRIILDLLGGRGNISSFGDAEIGIRRDLRSFELDGDTLRALHPPIGPFVDQLAGHTQTALGSTGSPGADEYLVAGIRLDEDPESAALVMDYGAPLGIDIADVAPAEPGTIRHAAVLLNEGVVAVLGGRGEDPTDVRASAAIYAADAGVWFEVDETALVNFVPRYGHTATVLEPGRILVLGGFDANGDAMTEPVIISFETADN